MPPRYDAAADAPLTWRQPTYGAARWRLPPVPRPPLWQPPRRKEDVTLFRISNWGQPLRETSVQQVLAHVLNCTDSPLRCVVDEKTVYFTPESSIITVGRTFSQQQYAEQWVEIGEDNPNPPE